jgi:hypothetical protein
MGCEPLAAGARRGVLTRMQTLIAFVDDAEHAQRRLAPLKDGQPVHWVLVACAPQLTRRVGKWVTQSARQQWRAKWCDKLFAALVPQLAGTHDQVTTVIAKRPLQEVARELQALHGTTRVFDARRPKFDTPPEGVDTPPRRGPSWGSIMGIGAALVIAID